MNKLDLLFKAAMREAQRGRNKKVRVSAVKRASKAVKATGAGYSYMCVGPARAGCGRGAVVASQPVKHGEAKKKAKKVVKKASTVVSKRAGKKAPTKTLKAPPGRPAKGSKEAKKWGQRMAALREAKKAAKPVAKKVKRGKGL